MTEQRLKAFLATENPPSDLIAAGWTPSDLIAAGWTPSDLRESQKELDSIPEIQNIYSRLLSDINNKKRLHKQSEWGPDYDPGTNICGTPMCTAGHLVNMAGKVGYLLQKKYGCAVTGRLIHMKNRPDAAPQNFGTIPQEFAMAYIRERAAEEKVNGNK